MSNLTDTSLTGNSNSVASLSAHELQHRLKTEPGLLVVDVREYPEFAQEHITPSRLLPLGQLQAGDSALNQATPVVVVCQSGKRSARAAKWLTDNGFQQVAQLEGGLTEWKRCGLPLARLPKAPWSMERQVRFVAGLLVLTGVLLSYIWQPAVLLSGAIGAGLAFAAVTNTCGMAMLLAKLPWNRPANLTCSR